MLAFIQEESHYYHERYLVDVKEQLEALVREWSVLKWCTWGLNGKHLLLSSNLNKPYS